jgi:hemerythrin
MDAHTRDAEPSAAASQIDRDHREVLESLSAFRSAINLRRPVRELTEKLAGFVATIERHFASEEELMRSSHYQDAAAHAAQHQRLLEQLHSVKEEFASGAINPCGTLALFVEVWTRQHIERHDNRFVEYLTQEAPTDASAQWGGPPGFLEAAGPSWRATWK